MRTKAAFALLAAGAVIAAAALSSGPTFGQNVRTVRVSVSTAGTEADGQSIEPAVSADGHYVAFASDSSNLVANDTPNRDVFVRDTRNGTTERVSVASDGTPGDSVSFYPSISGDGRYVVFQSDADNLVANDGNNASDIFLHDRTTGATTLVSVSSSGEHGNEDSVTPSISADGHFVTFTSLADNLGANDGNHDRDVFARDLVAGTTELVSQSSKGVQGNNISGGFGAGPARISADGHYIVFGSFANNLVVNDMNGFDDIFLRDRVAGITERVSISTDGVEGNGHSMYGSVSADGRYVVFFSLANNLVADDGNGVTDIFLRDRTMGTAARINLSLKGIEADGASGFPVISGDGIVVAYESDATNLSPDDMNGFRDIFLYHADYGWTERDSVPDGGLEESNHNSTNASVSGDGSVVAFHSDAWNLVLGDGNNAVDVFARGKAEVPPPTPTSTPTGGCPPLVGDANTDGSVNSIDAALVLQFGAGLLTSISPYADANHDGSTNSIDAALILQFTAGLLTCLPP